MNWKIGDKFRLLTLSFLDGTVPGFIILYKNTNYKLILKRYPNFGVSFTKETFNQSYYNRLAKTPTIVHYEWNGYFIYSLGKASKQYISARRHFVPLKLLHNTQG